MIWNKAVSNPVIKNLIELWVVLMLQKESAGTVLENLVRAKSRRTSKPDHHFNFCWATWKYHNNMMHPDLSNHVSMFQLPAFKENWRRRRRKQYKDERTITFLSQNASLSPRAQDSHRHSKRNTSQETNKKTKLLATTPKKKKYKNKTKHHDQRQGHNIVIVCWWFSSWQMSSKPSRKQFQHHVIIPLEWFFS